ncbi:D-sedoheptulose 7-phosphate isomerase [archaeon]|nr:D-sedoheptulose 7-phosphate isomerase [archaeon]
MKQRIQESIETKKRFLEDSNAINAIRISTNIIIESLKNNGKILICGNGGSAADAQHITGELVGRYKMERKGLPAIALTTDTSILTAWGNDYEFETIFSRQVEALGKKEDILIGISTSGNSENIIKAIEEAKKIGLRIITFTGHEGGKMKDLSDANINIPSDDTPRIQESHMVAYHTICELVEKEMSKPTEEENKTSSHEGGLI